VLCKNGGVSLYGLSIKGGPPNTNTTHKNTARTQTSRLTSHVVVQLVRGRGSSSSCSRSEVLLIDIYSAVLSAQLLAAR
jgi:hypothetical protein